MDYHTLAAKLNWYANLPFMLAHESCHYAAARLFRFPVEFHTFYVTFYPDDPTNWRVIVVILAPALAGGFTTSAMFVGGVAAQEWSLSLMPFLIFICWQLTCLSDCLMAYQFLRSGKWPAEVWKAPSKPATIEGWIRQKIDERRIQD